MEVNFCPNYKGCQIINIEGFVKDKEKRKLYLKIFCESNEGNWENCKRYITKKILKFCPDFVLPDSALTMEEIMNKIENND